MKISIIGTGVYSLAIAYALSKNNNEIHMWTHDKNIEQEFLNTKKLKSIADFDFSSNITVSSSLKNVMENTDLIYIGVSSKFFKITINQMKPFYNKNTPICIATKGIDEEDNDFLSNVLVRNLNTKKVSVLSGPTFAIDIINDEPVALALASKNEVTKNLVKKTLSSDKLKIRTCSDLIGVQLCGSIKNIIAIASGIVNGMGYSNSTTAFLINESMHDIKQTIHLLKGKKNTILSYAGVGDLLLTCTSPKSRNFSFGYVIGKHNDKNITLKYLEENTVEGYNALVSVSKLLKKSEVKIPLIKIINDIVIKGDNPEKLIKFLIEKE